MSATLQQRLPARMEAAEVNRESGIASRSAGLQVWAWPIPPAGESAASAGQCLRPANSALLARGPTDPAA